MKRKDFLRKGAGLLVAGPVTLACVKKKVSTDKKLSAEGSTNGSSAENCVVTKSETAGPFPIKNASNYAYQDITLDRTGIPMEVQITIKDGSSGCTAVEAARVDIWHCDADGNYSQYGSYSNANFLRGRQMTDSAGLAVFKTIFPGWYSGRAVHIHAQVFDSSGKSLLITQIAFPPDICDAVYKTAKDYYKKGLADTSNERDTVFNDGYEDELATITGSIDQGFTLTHTIVV